MKIEPSTKNNLPRLLDIFNLSRDSNESFPKQVYSMDEFLEATEGEEILVARIGKEVVGFASLWKPDNFLHHLFVSPQYQGKGVGKALVSESVRKFCLPMSLKCFKANTEACRFYEQLGWEARAEDVGPEGLYIHYYRGKNA